MNTSPVTARIYALARLMRIDKPVGTLLLLWPTLWALWLAGKAVPSPEILTVFMLGVFFMRTAGCVINDYADRNIDGHVFRTRSRPLPSGAVSKREARLLFIVLLLISFVLVLKLNAMTVCLSFAGVALACCYPFMKRFTHLPQVVLGAAFGWAIPMAWAAVTESVPLTCWLLFGANLCWTVAYDTQYAMVDRNDDVKIGVKSTAILFGRYDRLVIALFQLASLLLLTTVGLRMNLNGAYWGSLLLAGGLFIYQQKLIKLRKCSACFQAFLNNNYVGLVLFAGILLSTAPFTHIGWFLSWR